MYMEMQMAENRQDTPTEEKADCKAIALIHCGCGTVIGNYVNRPE